MAFGKKSKKEQDAAVKPEKPTGTRAADRMSGKPSRKKDKKDGDGQFSGLNMAHLLERVQNLTIIEAITVGVSCFAVFLLVGCLIFVSKHTADYKAQRLEDQGAYDSLIRQRDELDLIVNPPAEDTGDVNTFSPFSAGSTVADVQSSYNGAAAYEMESKHDSWFSKTSRYFTQPWMSEPWITIEDSTRQTGGKRTWVWEFRTTYECTGESVEVLWICRNTNSEKVMAYATAVYTDSTGVFSDLSVHRTTTTVKSLDGVSVRSPLIIQ